jgi:hypothetical protein
MINYIKEVISIIKSISYDQTEIIQSILKLHVPQNYIDCDCTYSKGNFYKNNDIQEPLYKFDIEPQTPDTIKADARNLPLNNESVNCIMFDPPFLATVGKSLTIDNGSNKINKRFGVFKNEIELHNFYVDVLKETYRILKDDGILIFKCQDKVSSSKQYMSHCFIWQEAIKIGYYPKDLFVLLAKNRIVADWQLKNQKNARKFHSYFWVFEKSNKQIKYIN